MVSSAATTVSQYLASLPADRRAELSRVREVINANLPDGYEEGIVYGMISWYVPRSRKPDTYNNQPLCLASLAAQKNYSALYLLSVYGDRTVEQKFRAGFAAAGKKLDMGKSCVRFKSADDLALDAVAGAINVCGVETLIARHDAVHGAKRSSRAKPAAKATRATSKSRLAKSRSTTKTRVAKSKAMTKTKVKATSTRSRRRRE